jgi:PEGA domain
MMVGQLGRGVAPRVVAILLGTAVLSGCVERRYTIRTDPPGALAIVNGEEIGPTPVSRSFVYYGDREITLLRNGYETLHVVQPVDAPWWDNLLTEFFTENVVPVTLRDEREFAYRMAPEVQPARNELLDRAEGLRAQAKQPPPPRRGGILGFFGF